MSVRHKSKIISVFGSSRPRENDDEYKLALEIGSLLARSGYIVCNGGYGGTMEASARGAKQHGGSTIGIITDFFSPVANRYIDTIIRTPTLVERLLKLIETADAYVILQGSTGTLLELSAVWEFMNKSVIPQKPIIIVGNFWQQVIDSLRKELAFEGKFDATTYITIAANPSDCIEKLNRIFAESSQL